MDKDFAKAFILLIVGLLLLWLILVNFEIMPATYKTTSFS